MSRHWKNAATAAAACFATALMLSFVSCSSNDVGSDGLPRRLPDIQLDGTTETPPHSMASHEYPFDSSGRYVSEWAAEGERRAGRSAAATRDDSSRWGSSHGGGSSGRKSASSSSSKSKSKSKSGSTAKTKSKSGGRSYTVKKGDTLSHIASRHGTSVSKIKAANGMSSDFLSIGKVLRIP
jgi:hypothetical protein